MRERKLATCDAETDPFLHRRVPIPFVWGFYDGKTFLKFYTTKEFVEYIRTKRLVLYAHNGGKFDFMYFIPFLGETTAQIIHGRIVAIMIGKCELRDSYAAMPEAMKQIKKTEIEYWKLEASVREEHKEEIENYLFDDCRDLFVLMKTYRQEVGTKTTIAANAFRFCTSKLQIKVGKTSHHFDKEFRNWYFGGRTQCFQDGVHQNIAILDIKSAYPFAMLHNHAIGELKDFHCASAIPEEMTREQLERSFLKIECFAKGCFPIRPDGPNGLEFPHAYGEYKVTGWEFVAARDLGLMENLTVKTIQWSDRMIHFKPYVEHWFKYKEDNSKKNEHGDYINPERREIGKRMLNAYYGKLAQNPAMYADYKIVPAGTKICRKFIPNKPGAKLCNDCGKFAIDHGWEWCIEFDQIEIHYRPSLWKFQNFQNEPWEGKKLYKNVATAASITGFTRAYLLRAIHTIGLDKVIYTDTDSLICKSSADLSKLPVNEKIGGWSIEDDCAPIGYFAGKKLYAITLSKLNTDGSHKEKIASKGAKLTFADVKRITEGETVTWRNPAPSYNILSGRTPFTKTATGEIDLERLFVVRDIRATAQSRTGRNIKGEGNASKVKGQNPI